MRRFATFGAAFPLLALGVACSANNTPAPPTVFKQFDVMSDFEASGFSLNKDPRWDGSWEKSADQSGGKPQEWAIRDLTMDAGAGSLPPRVNEDGSTSAHALQIQDYGAHTLWGSAWLVRLKNDQPVDLSGYTGISFWTRSDNFPPPTVKVSLPDQGSYPGAKNPDTGEFVCDMNDNTVGGRGCYDDYSVKMYPDGAWTRVDIAFSSLTTGGYGLKHDFDPTRVYALKFSMLPATSYSVWIDDVFLYLK